MTRRQPDRNPLANGAILERVVEQVEKHLPECFSVDNDFNLLVERLRDLHLPHRCERDESGNSITNERRETDTLWRQRRHWTFCTRESERVVNEMHQSPRFANNDICGVAPLAIRAGAIERQRLAEK